MAGRAGRRRSRFAGRRALRAAPERRGRRLWSARAHFARPLRRAVRGLHAPGTALGGGLAARAGLLSQRHAPVKFGPKTVQVLFYFARFPSYGPEFCTTLPGPLPVAGPRLLTSVRVTSARDAPRLAPGSRPDRGLSGPGRGNLEVLASLLLRRIN